MKILIFTFLVFVSSVLLAKQKIDIECDKFDYCILIEEKAEKEKIGDEIYKYFKDTEKNFKVYFNKILVPPFLRQNLKVEVDIGNEIEIGYVYKYEF